MQSKQTSQIKNWWRETGRQPTQSSIDGGEPITKGPDKPTVGKLVSSLKENLMHPLSHQDQSSLALTQISDTPASKLAKTLWGHAYTSLSVENPKLVEGYESLLLDTDLKGVDKQGQMAAMVKKQQELLTSKQWTLKISGKSVKVRDQMKRITDAFKKVKDLGTAVAKIDPIYVGLPWAGVSYLLSLISNDFDQNEALLDGLKKISEIIARYAEASDVHLNTTTTEKLDSELKSRIIKLYTCIFKFQATTACHFSHSTLMRFVRNLPKLDNWGKILLEVESEDENCDKWRSIQDSRVLRIINEHMNLLPPTPQTSTIVPSYFEVPTGRKIPRFIGRKDILAKIASVHSRDLSSRAGIVVLRGMGGQGKTQIALEYCHISRNIFNAIFWVNASSESSASESFGAIFAKIKSQDDVCGSNEAKVEFVKNSLRTWNFKWLIVFDNHDTPKDFSLEDFIPHSTHGSVLITTRHKHVDELVESIEDAAIELLGLSEKEALQLLYQQSSTEESEVNEKNGYQIVKRLGYHALAITQAGTYIRKLQLDFSAFESHYSQRREAILKYEIPMSKYTKSLNETEKETAFNVFTTWELSFNELKAQQHPAAFEKLLTLFAFFDPTDISEEVFSTRASRKKKPYYMSINPEGRDFPPVEILLAFFLDEAGVWDSNIFAGALEVLERLSLIQSFVLIKDKYHVSLHPLVKDWIRLRTEKSICEENSILAVDLIGSYILEMREMVGVEDSYAIDKSKRQVALAHINAYEDNLGYITSPIAAIGPVKRLICEHIYFNEIGLYEDALSITRHVYELKLRKYGPESGETVFSMNMLGLVLARAGELEEAEKLQRQVLAYNSKLEDNNGSTVIEPIVNLAQTLKECGKLEEAEDLCRRAIGLQVNLVGEGQLETVQIKAELAELLSDTPKASEAYTLCTGMIDTRETWAILSGDIARDSAVIELLKILITVLLRVKRCGEALSMALYQFDLAKQRYGNDHYYSLNALNLIGPLLFIEKKYYEAEQFSRRAWMDAEKALGSSCPQTLQYKLVYAEMLRNLGRKDKAKDLANEVLRKLEELCGKESKELLEAKEKLGWLDEPNEDVKMR